MTGMYRFVTGYFTVLLLISMAVPASAQIEDQLSAYTGRNATGYLKPLADAFGADMNAGLFNSAQIPKMGPRIRLEIRVISVIFGDGDRTFKARTEGDFTPEQTVDAPTVVGQGQAKIIGGDAGTSFAFPGGLDLSSFAIAVPQLRFGAVHGTEALIRYFAVNTGDTEIGDLSLFGFGLRHSISQYFGKQLPVDLAAGFMWQRFKLGDDLISANTFMFGVHASRKFVIMEPYAGLSIDTFSMDVTFDSDVLEDEIFLDFEKETSLHLTLGLNINLTYAQLFGEFSLAGQNSFSFGLALGI